MFLLGAFMIRPAYKLVWFGSLFMAIAVLAGCDASRGGHGFDSGKVDALCTTNIVADAVAHVGGEWVAVEALMGAGVDPHRYQAVPSDIARLQKARIIFHNGLHLEGKMADLFARSGSRAVAVTRTIDPKDLRKADAEFGDSHDPHVWFDVRLWMKAVECVRDELAALDPAHAADYRANAEAYLKELDALDLETHAVVERLPKERRVLVTSHDAFGYFGHAYGFEVHGLQGVSTASEVGINERVALARLLGTRKVPAVFTETSVTPQGLQAVLDTAKQDWGHAVRLVGGEGALYSDALGAPGTPGGTYPGMIRHNVSVIVTALSP